MIFSRTDATTPSADAWRWRRWLVVGLLSLLLHGLTLHWMGGVVGLPMQAPESAPPEVLRTVLVQAQPAPPAIAPAPRGKVASAAQPKPPRPQAPARAPEIAPAPEPAPAAITQAPTAVPAAPAPDVSAAAPVAASTATELASAAFSDPNMVTPGPPVAAQSAPAADHTRYKVDPPPPATLQYDVEAKRDGQMVYGHGAITWQFNGSHYTINGKAGILFLSLLDFSSRGQTDAFGIAPEQYTEKRFRRPQTDTLFNRERNQISFSTSDKTFALQGGEQDRASVVWQLAGIGRGDAAQFVPDAQIPLFIAGVRDGGTWNIHVLGEEEIEVGLGKLRAWHVRRAPRPGDKDQTIDIWLAPSRHWYPIRLRYTESNGEYLDLSLAKIEAAPPR